MVLPHPLHKRLLSRIGFYGGVACYLWLLQFVEQQIQADSFRGSEITSVIVQ